LWKKARNGRLINKRHQHNWIYGNKKFLFARTDKNKYDNKCSASIGICFLAYIHDWSPPWIAGYLNSINIQILG
jgi:hypothetical protein